MNQGTSSVSVSSNGYVSVANNGLNSNNAPSYNQNLNQGGSSVTVSSNSASSNSGTGVPSSSNLDSRPSPSSINVWCSGSSIGYGYLSGINTFKINVVCRYA